MLSVAAVLAGDPAPEEAEARIRVFTDPLSAWCWGAEPVLLRLAEVFGGAVAIEYRMVGLFQNLEDLTRPDQMAMQWEEVAHLTGMPFYSDVWTQEPASSSWPACAALKAAQMQDATRAERLLRRLRESALCEGRDIADTSELMNLAGEVGLDLDRFATALESGAAGNAFNEDLLIAAELGEVTCPSYFIEGSSDSIALRGACPFDELMNAVSDACGGLVSLAAEPRDVRDRHAYVSALADARGSITAAEIAELLGIERAAATDLLDRMSSGGSLVRVDGGTARLYRTTGHH